MSRKPQRRIAANTYEYLSHWTGTGITTDHLAQFGEDAYTALSSVVRVQMAKFIKIDPLSQEIRDQEAFGRERSGCFVGRSLPLQVIFEYCNRIAGYPLAVVGDAGSGKTALLGAALKKLQRNSSTIRIISRFIGATPASSNSISLLDSLCRQIYHMFDFETQKRSRISELIRLKAEDREKRQRQIERDYELPTDFHKLSSTFQTFMTRIPEGARLILVLDALDRLPEADDGRSLSWLPAELPEGLRIIVSSSSGPTADLLAKMVPCQYCLKLPPLSASESENLLRRWLDEDSRTLQPHQTRQVMALFEKNGLPLYLRLVFEEVRDWPSYFSGDDIAADIHGQIKSLLERICLPRNHGRVMVAHSLGYLAAARNGLTEDELLDLLSEDAAVMKDLHTRSPFSPQCSRLPVVIWSRLYHDLEPFLTEKKDDRTVLISFFQHQFYQSAVQMFCAGQAKSDQHAFLEAFFRRQELWSDGGGENGS